MWQHWAITFVIFAYTLFLNMRINQLRQELFDLKLKKI